MIKTIIKRNGQKENFIPKKINGWGMWASAKLGSRVDWTSIVVSVVVDSPEEITSEELQIRLINKCLDKRTDGYYLMAGRLYGPLIQKQIYNGVIPTIKEVHTNLQNDGIMHPLNYSDEEYAELEKVIDHTLDYDQRYIALEHTRNKYALRNRFTKKEYETMQFVYMRMAMSIYNDNNYPNRLELVKEKYKYLSEKTGSAPTPNFTNLGTYLKGYASCAVYTTADTGESLMIGDIIANTLTRSSAGIGAHITCRSIGDPVRGGTVIHGGKLPYYRSVVGSANGNKQNGRAGAVTMFYNVFDPEVDVIIQLKNPKSPEDKKIRGLDYAISTNKVFAYLAQNNKDMFTFNCFTAPELYRLFYTGDIKGFKKEYDRLETDPAFKKTYINARDTIVKALIQSSETGRYYGWMSDEANRHTPFKEPIHSSNLCLEIDLVNSAYTSVMDLYSKEDHGRGEIALCSLGAINIAKAYYLSDEEYEKLAYHQLMMIDQCIDLSEYQFPHLEFTAKARRSAGVGLTGYAELLAKEKIKYDSNEGMLMHHKVAERHMYFMIRASLKIAKEKGVCDWMHKTKWPDGWLPIDTYNKNVDTIADFKYYYNWEELRQEVIANKGIRNSVLVAYMPCESSSKAIGGPNGLYPVRELVLLKGDENNAIKWAAPHGDNPEYEYQLAYDINNIDLIKMYAIFQKFTDQGISADVYDDLAGNKTIDSDKLLNEYFAMIYYGLKSWYYRNTRASKKVDLSKSEVAVSFDEVGDCTDGSCKM